MTSWKHKPLSFGGGLCLLNSVLGALPLFFLSFFRIPKGVAIEAKRIMWTFLWGGFEEASNIFWVKWDQVCKPKYFDGLGVKDLVLFKNALLGKWRWKLLMGNTNICSRVIQARYGDREHDGLFTTETRDSIWWKDLFKVYFESEEDEH